MNRLTEEAIKQGDYRENDVLSGRYQVISPQEIREAISGLVQNTKPF